MKKIAVVLSGCGVYDGAEIHEATLSLLAIAKQGASYQVFAPNVEQHHVINHLTGEAMKESRNVLVESARIARGAALDLKDFDPVSYDAILFPGGFGAAKNLSSWAFEGASSTVLPEVAKAIEGMNKLGKPIGALCISPVLLAKLLEGVEVTIGNDADTVAALKTAGASHVDTTHGEVVIDETYRAVTTPCYMLDATIDQIETGATNVVKALLKMTE